MTDKQPARIYGADRYGTAIGIADQLRAANGGKRFTSVIVASGLNFADALSAAYLAKVKNAPILLTGTKSMPKETTNAIEKLGAKKAVILGGTGAVSDELAQQAADHIHHKSL